MQVGIEVARRSCSARSARATLPWYDFEEIQWATDAFWDGLAGRLRAAGLRDVPEARGGSEEYEADWRRPDLLFSQCCGYDAALPLRGVVRLVATPCYRAPGCDGPTYSSLVVVREDSPVTRLEDLRGARCVINNPTSHSGTNALRALVGPLSRGGRFFSAVYASGGHSRSLRMVQAGEADVAAIDCVVIEIVRRHLPELLRGIRVIAATAPAPAPPYVTRAGLRAADLGAIRQALGEVMVDPDLRDAREALLLGGIALLPLRAYAPMVAMGRRTRALGYREMDAALPR